MSNEAEENPPPDINAIRGLLRHTSQATSFQRELDRISGANFNLFHILVIGHYEVSTHTPILRELLDPKGSHGQGTKFLDFFLKCIEGLPEIDAKTAKVGREVYVGARTDVSGGRLDLVIEDAEGKKIIIENKIYAQDQENWAIRYSSELGSDGMLVYLTLDGREVETDGLNLESDDHSKVNVRALSYAQDIIKWLELCRKEVFDVAVVRETISQYIDIIKFLTHQNTSDRMNEEIVRNVLESEKSYFSYIALKRADLEIKNKIAERLHSKIEKCADQLNLTTTHFPNPWGSKFAGYRFSNKNLDAMNLNIVFQFDKAYYEKFFFGFSTVEKGAERHDRNLVRSFFEQRFGLGDSSAPYPAWKWYPKKNWDDETFARIAFGDFAEELNTYIKKMSSVADDICRDPII